MPMMPFIGVRISWLMLARNSLLARVADSAFSFSPRNASSCVLDALQHFVELFGQQPDLVVRRLGARTE